MKRPNEGRIPWNKGMKVDRKKYSNMGHFKKHTKEAKELMKKSSRHLKGEQIGNWMGDNVGYRALHDWVRKWKGKPLKCNFCNSNKRPEWANKSREYRRDFNDWISLCHACHMIYDSGENWGKAVGKYGKTL